MKQPKLVRILECSDKNLYKLPDTPIKCRLQEREPGDDSKIVYVSNPWFNPDLKSENDSESEFIAFTHTEYEVVEWTKK
jgi:hypothetical protein